MCFLIDKHLSNSCQLSDIFVEIFLRRMHRLLSARHSLTYEDYFDKILLKVRTFFARVRKKDDSRLLVNFSFTHEPPVDRSLQSNLLDTSMCACIYIGRCRFIHPSIENSTFPHSNYTLRFLCSCFLSFFFAIVVVEKATSTLNCIIARFLWYRYGHTKCSLLSPLSLSLADLQSRRPSACLTESPRSLNVKSH